MADLLLRDIAPNVKEDIGKRARAHGRSLSDEAKHLLRVGLHADSGMGKTSTRTALQAMEAAFADCHLSPAEQDQFQRDLDQSRQSDWIRKDQGE